MSALASRSTQLALAMHPPTQLAIHLLQPVGLPRVLTQEHRDAGCERGHERFLQSRLHHFGHARYLRDVALDATVVPTASGTASASSRTWGRRPSTIWA